MSTVGKFCKRAMGCLHFSYLPPAGQDIWCRSAQKLSRQTDAWALRG